MLEPGTRLGPYEILGPLGAGGMGEVYRARDEKLARDVAVKILPEELARDPERLARFEQEARAASGLNHPNIIHIYDVGREGPTAFMVMELVEGRNLRAVIQDGPPPLRKALELGEQAAAGLAKAHAAGIVHRDLKPENLMVTEDGVLKILDFGLAKLMPGADVDRSEAPTALGPQTGSGVVVGTVGYMSPEQARGGGVGFASDQFALGSVLYELLTGRRAFERDSAVQTLSAIIEDEPEPLTDRNARAPLPLRWIIERCLAKEPAERYASTLDLARDLRTVREHLSEVGRVAAELPGTPTATRRRGGAGGIFLGGVVLGLIVGLALLFLTWRLVSTPAVEPPPFRKFTFTGSDRQPAVSPDGRVVAFTSERGGVPQIWIKRVEGAAEVALTEGPDEAPRFSPDGSQILFSRREPDRANLYRVPVLGGEPRRVLEDALEGDWSADGRSVAFVRILREGESSSGQVGIASLDGSSTRILGELEHRLLFGPRFSPDGGWIATSTTSFGTAEGASRNIFLVRTDGSEQRSLAPTDPGGDLSAVAWLASGDDIVYSQGESVSSVSLGSSLLSIGASRILRQQVSSGRSQVLFWTPQTNQTIDVLAPGALILDGASARQNLQEHVLDQGPRGTGRSLSRGASMDRQPVYSPDGKWVTFSSNRSGNLDIWSLSLQDGTLRQLTDHPEDDWDPAYMPDGRLVFTSRRTGNFEIWLAEADGAAPRQVSRDGVDAENATSTPDGAWIIYNSGRRDLPGLWKVRPDGTDATHLMEGTVQWPEASPDGIHASFTTSKRAGLIVISVVRIEDGVVVPFEISIPTTEFASGRHRWMPDGRAIAFTSHGPGERTGIFVQDFAPGADTTATRRPLILFEAGALPETFGISPDGDRIIVARSSRDWSLLTLEGLPGVLPPGGTAARR